MLVTRTPALLNLNFRIGLDSKTLPVVEVRRQALLILSDVSLPQRYSRIVLRKGWGVKKWRPTHMYL